MHSSEAWLLSVLVFPLWSLTGTADWACHRASGIAHTSGLRENLLHWVLFTQVSVLVMSMALLQVNAALLLLMGALWLVHEATVWAELRYTLPRRTVGAAEQMVHSFQELMPLLALVLLASMAWDQALAIVGVGSSGADLTLRWKSPMLPLPLLAGGVALALLFNVAPLAQETLACLRARRKP